MAFYFKEFFLHITKFVPATKEKSDLFRILGLYVGNLFGQHITSVLSQSYLKKIYLGTLYYTVIL